MDDKSQISQIKGKDFSKHSRSSMKSESNQIDDTSSFKTTKEERDGKI